MGDFAQCKTCLFLLLTFYLFYFIFSLPAQVERIHFTLQNTISPKTDFSKGSKSTNIVDANVLIHDSLKIPKINVEAPIIWDVPLNDALLGLQNGVVQVSESVLPGEIGRTLIVGHSSGYWWMHNQWTKVFSLIDKLETGDHIYLKYGNRPYSYVVNRREVVRPNDVSVLSDSAPSSNELVLVTCTPVGTTLNRLLVFATLESINY